MGSGQCQWVYGVTVVSQFFCKPENALKWTEFLNKHVSEEDTEMSSKLLKRCPASLFTGDMHVPTSGRYHSAPTRTTTEIGKPWSVASTPRMEQVELWCAAGGNVKWLRHGRAQPAIPQDVQHGAAWEPAVPPQA